MRKLFELEISALTDSKEEVAISLSCFMIYFRYLQTISGRIIFSDESF
jgi:hypothetical protein